MIDELAPDYLQPYLDAVQKYGAGFGALLWASPKTQAARFEALVRAMDMEGLVVLDAGCGRGDFLEFLLGRGVSLGKYIGLEAVENLAEAASRKNFAHCEIVRGDFVKEPQKLEMGADVIVFCGSLNTLDERAFYRTLSTAFCAARVGVVFNFLNSPYLASSAYLTWHRAEAVLAFAGKFSGDVQMWDDYLKGDATVVVRKESGAL